jgi:hypothetical protein
LCIQKRKGSGREGEGEQRVGGEGRRNGWEILKRKSLNNIAISELGPYARLKPHDPIMFFIPTSMQEMPPNELSGEGFSLPSPSPSSLSLFLSFLLFSFSPSQK